MKYPLKHKVLALFLVVTLLVSVTSCSSSGENVLITCNGLSITESTFLLLMTEQAGELLGQEGVTEDNVVEKAKEAVLAYLPTYTYYKQGYTQAKYALDEDTSSKLRASALSLLLSSGLEYDPDRENEIFMEHFGVTFQQYMVYQEESYLMNYYYNEELEKKEVDGASSKAYFDENREAYAFCVADIVRIAKDTGSTQTPEEIRQQLALGKTLEECKRMFGEILNKTETLTFDSSSNLDSAFGTGFVETMVNSQAGDVVLLETNTFITVARTNTLGGYTEHLDEIENTLKIELYEKEVAEIVSAQAYVPQIVDKNAYDAITEIPGSKLQ